ncbi:SsrA-binding protein SmpB [Candidatus Roizmanbacteria bacterium]|nr:SsrA-binding protein SmpB [Candidatus Roizmanbacteria bacterium]
MTKIINRKFNRTFTLLEKIEAGIALTGAEVKSARKGMVRIDDAFVRIIAGEAYLVNAEIAVYPYSQPQGYDPRRTRKLLLHKKELVRLKTKMASARGLTVAPVAWYNKRSLMKLEIALVKGKKEFEKKRLDKQKDVERQQKREAKEYMKH